MIDPKWVENVAASVRSRREANGWKTTYTLRTVDLDNLLTEYRAMRSIVEALAQHPPVYWPRLGMIACADCGAELRSNTDTTAHFLACSHRRAVELLGIGSGE